jgi:hypothetical protein
VDSDLNPRSPNTTRKETSSEACQGRARFQQLRDASCHQVFFFLQHKAPKEIHAILTEILACFLPGRAKDLSAPLCYPLLPERSVGNDDDNVSVNRILKRTVKKIVIG